MAGEIEMAQQFFGYGRWNAEYWFIGPEQGKGPKEVDGNSKRVAAWIKLGMLELYDCKQYHNEIDETCWHRSGTGLPKLQSTWRSLMLPLMILLGKSPDAITRKSYQRDGWGREDGDTCVIELCAFAAKSSKEFIEREQFKPERIATIQEKLRQHKPKVVVMYGLRDRASWEEIAGGSLSSDGIKKQSGTCFVMTPHPNTRGRTNAEWINLGERLQKSVMRPEANPRAKAHFLVTGTPAG